MMKEFLADFALFMQAVEEAMIERRPRMLADKVKGLNVCVSSISPAYLDPDKGDAEYVVIGVSTTWPDREDTFSCTFEVFVDVSDITACFERLKANNRETVRVPIKDLATGFCSLELN